MKDRAIATIVIGEEARQNAKYSVPLMGNYAKRTSSALIVIEKSVMSDITNEPFYEKYQVGNILNDYKRVLFLDSDILVLPHSPNVFEMVPEECFAAVSVESVYPKVEHEKNSISGILGEISWTVPYFNAGAMLFSQSNKSLYQDTGHFLKQWICGKNKNNIKALHDQTLINYCANYFQIKFFDLGKSFNYTRIWGSFHHRLLHYFIHYAGLNSNRSWQMMRDYNISNSKIKYSILCKYPSLLYLYDRLHFQNIKRNLFKI